MFKHWNIKITEYLTAPDEADEHCKWEANLESLPRGLSSGFWWQMPGVPSSASCFSTAPSPDGCRALDAPADGCGDWRHPSFPRAGPLCARISQKPESYFCFLPPVLSILPLASIDFPQFPEALIKQLPTRLPRRPLLLFVEQKNHQPCLQRCLASGVWD